LESGTFDIIRLGVLIIGSAFFISFSRRSLRNPLSHGFYRFFALEGILVLVLLNLPYWHDQMFSTRQLFSWTILTLSILFVVGGLLRLRRHGGHQHRQEHPENLAFENTEKVVRDGIYRYIRHPMYGSLLLLAWGALLKNIGPEETVITLLVSLLLFLTARMEERENVDFFGEDYTDYMKGTRMFIPYIF
jgi:protein-S-isoprenylcysteine O-methyltransferase Ste14